MSESNKRKRYVGKYQLIICSYGMLSICLTVLSSDSETSDNENQYTATVQNVDVPDNNNDEYNINNTPISNIINESNDLIQQDNQNRM